MLIKQIALLGGKLFKNTEQQVVLPNAVSYALHSSSYLPLPYVNFHDVQECEQEFKRLWLEQGDYISVLYAGSRYCSTVLVLCTIDCLTIVMC